VRLGLVEPDRLAGVVDDQGTAVAVLHAWRKKDVARRGTTRIGHDIDDRWPDIRPAAEEMRIDERRVLLALGRRSSGQQGHRNREDELAVTVIGQRDVRGDRYLLARCERPVRDIARATTIPVRHDHAGMPPALRGGHADVHEDRCRDAPERDLRSRRRRHGAMRRIRTKPPTFRNRRPEWLRRRLLRRTGTEASLQQDACSRSLDKLTATQTVQTGAHGTLTMVHLAHSPRIPRIPLVMTDGGNATMYEPETSRLMSHEMCRYRRRRMETGRPANRQTPRALEVLSNVIARRDRPRPHRRR